MSMHYSVRQAHDSRELIKRIRRIQIRTSHIVDNMLGGQYHSAFKGRGIEFEEVRPYQVGDDVRTIDWNVTARSGEPFVKLFREERELTVTLLVDLSASQDSERIIKRNANWSPNSARRWPSRRSRTTTKSACTCSPTTSKRSCPPARDRGTCCE